jgi:ankyrin repeat protein
MNSTFVKIDDKYDDKCDECEEKSELNIDDFPTLKQLWFARNTYGKCVWTSAIGANNVRMVEMMLNQGVKADTEITVGSRFALGFAVTSGYLEMFQLLLKHGADIEITDKFGNNIFHIIAINNRSNEFLDALQASTQYRALTFK